jgi:hypothetical protein
MSIPDPALTVTQAAGLVRPGDAPRSKLTEHCLRRIVEADGR